ncbi:MAG: hypothetical protein JWQ72_3298 [Polaromonas sp.]|nr:hypothetical protein [Polaromonas sp.]
MFLDAATGSYLWGITLLGVSSLLVLLSVVALICAGRAWKACRTRLAWGLTIPAAAALACLTLGAFSLLVDHRLDKEVLIDLRKPKTVMLQDVARICVSKQDDDHCDSRQYSLQANVVFPEGLKLAVKASDIRWAPIGDKSFAYISVMTSNALTLHAARQALRDHWSLLSTGATAKTQEELQSMQEWLSRPNDQKLYSEVRTLKLRPYFSLVFRKNVDRVALDYSITSTYRPDGE